MAEVKAAEAEGRKPDSKFFNYYNKEAVKESLEVMYRGLCCYCEGRIGAVAYAHIEHRRPKAVFPENTYDWDNLHLCCPMCNGEKGDKWDRTHEILDAVVDRPVNEHLSYRLSDRLGVQRRPLTPRGKTTREHAGLDREKLRECRLEVALRVLAVIALLNDSRNSEETIPLRDELEAQVAGEYGSLVQWVIDTYSRSEE